MPNPNVVSEIQLSYKYHVKPNDMPKVSNSEQAYQILLANWQDESLDLFEQSKVMLLNRAGRVLGLYHLAGGGVASCPMDTRLVLVAALKTNAASIIIAHNHPSGNLHPSQDDIKITKDFKAACNLLNIKLHDHIIVSRDGYYSFTEEMAFEKVQRGNAHYYEALQPF